MRKLLRWVCFAAFGIMVFSNPLDRWNPAYIGFGMTAGLLFGYLFRKFLRGFLSMFNGSLKKEMGREAIAWIRAS